VLSGGALREAIHTQVWFGPEQRPLFGWVSMPADRMVRGGVVLCPPMGEEARAAHRTFRRLTETLAGHGFVALRFDYDGTGDSAGGQHDPDRVQAWLDSVTAAGDYVSGLGAPDLSAIGMRLGATLAAAAAAAPVVGAQYRSLVLWDPCQSGRTFLREGEALLAFGEGDGRARDEAFRHTPGFQYDLDTAKALRGLDFARIDGEQSWAERTMLLSRDDRPAVDAILDRVQREPQVHLAPATGQADLLDVGPSDSVVPQQALESIVEWICAGAGDLAVPVQTPQTRPVRLTSDQEASPVILEAIRSFGPVGLFGLTDTPADPSPGAPWLVLVNVAAEHHVGPGRRWVEFARRWAGQGYRVVRIDQSGVGDSPTHPGQVEGAPFAPAWIDDMREVVRDLAADGSRVFVLGLCSGSYSGLEVALWEHVDGVFAVNPRLTLWPAAKDSEVYTPLRRAGIVPARPLAHLARNHRILAGGLWRIYRQFAVWHAPFRVLRAVVRRGTPVHVHACADDAQHFTEVAFWRPALARLRRDPRFRFECSEVFDHSLLTREAQEATLVRAEEFLATHAPLPTQARQVAAS
jgi:alpha-beta hydrolase superfamily lysophospholipase